jgi:hypothetical protein
MIKFFRKIRQKMLTEKRIGKYLIYAVGEILLVVIGILIALYLNNQNLNRQTEEKIDGLLSEVLVDLDDLIRASNNGLTFYANKKELLNLILSDKLTYEDYESSKYDNLMQATTWYNYGERRQIAFDNLIKEINYIPEKYKSIMQGLTRMYNNEFNIKYSNMIEDMSNNNIKKRADNYEWFSSMVPDNQNKEMIDFMLNDFRYKSEVKHYAMIVSYHMSYILDDKLAAEKYYNEISTLLDKPVINRSINDLETASLFIGDWVTKKLPDSVLTIYEEDNQLYIKDNNKDSTLSDIYIISKNKALSSNGVFLSLMKENENYVFRFAGLEFRKVKE